MARSAEGKDLKDDVSNYNSDAYEKSSVTVDICICSIINNDLEILLIKRKYPPYRNYWAIPGGFVNLANKESLEKTAARELEEETGLKNIYIEQLKAYGDPDRDPRMRIITIAFFALIPYNLLKNQTIKADDDARDAKWFSLRNLPKLGFDHTKILDDLFKKLKDKINLTDIAFNFLPSQFTWSELQNIYEIIIGKSLTISNFRRKIKSTYNLKKLIQKKTKKIGRPPVYLKYEGYRNK